MINFDKIAELSQTIEIDEDTTGTTAYGVWKIAKEAFENMGIEFSMTSQSFYNFAKNGKINGIKDSKGRFSDDEIETFVATLIAKELRK